MTDFVEMELEDFRKQGGHGRPLRHNAIPKHLDGIHFGSTAEMRVYQNLKLEQAAGLIADLRVHTRHLLQAKFTYQGETIPAIYYVDDFNYLERGVRVVVDVKGFGWKKHKRKPSTWEPRITAEARTKINWFKRLYPEVDFRIVEG